MENDKISMVHGAGGLSTQKLIREIFIKELGNEFLVDELDGAFLDLPSKRIVMSTDSYVVSPLFFPGGDIGKLAVCGTVNDLAVMGAKPHYLTLGLIIEAGFSVTLLQKIIRSVGQAARVADVQIVTGDTKVVPAGLCDGLYINTAGVGTLLTEDKLHPRNICPGDKIIISGTVGDHGVAILAAREGLEFSPSIVSDCTAVHPLTEAVIASGARIKCMRDPTRGGLATVAHEIVQQSHFGIRLMEGAIPIQPQVAGASSMLGLDPLYLANEGKVVIVVDSDSVAPILEVLRKDAKGKDASIIGEVTGEYGEKVVLQTELGTTRLMRPMDGDPLPRIC